MRLRCTARSLLVIAAVLVGSAASVAVAGPAHAVSGLTTASGLRADATPAGDGT